jgi:SM-20-related protein
MQGDGLVCTVPLPAFVHLLQPDMEPGSAFNKLLEMAVDALAGQGWGVFDNAFPVELADALIAESRSNEDLRYQPAGIGRKDLHQTDLEIRSDGIQWLRGMTEAERRYLDLMEAMRSIFNRELFLGLFDYECMFARYKEGAFYLVHKDAFTGERNRVLSTVLYLNPDWQPDDGGELVLYAEDARTVLQRITPRHNRLVLFLSEQFPHEVLPTNRIRYSLTGWFRVNPSEGWKRPV